MRRRSAYKCLPPQGTNEPQQQPPLDATDAVRYLAYLLPSLVHMAETSGRPMLAYYLDMARLEAADTRGETPSHYPDKHH